MPRTRTATSRSAHRVTPAKCTASSFTDNGNGTITDDDLGLTWEKLSNDGSIHQFTATHDFAEALTKVASLNAMSFAGHTDWRLPSVRELHTLLRPGPAPLVDPIFNTGCVLGCTVTTCSCTSSSVFNEDTFRSLGPGAGVAGELASSVNHVRAVRAL